jgi:hypothetical protein
MTMPKTDTGLAAFLDAVFLMLCGTALLTGIIVFQQGSPAVSIGLPYAADIAIAVEVTVKNAAAFVQEIIPARFRGASQTPDSSASFQGGFLGEAAGDDVGEYAIADITVDAGALSAAGQFAAGQFAAISAKSRRGIIIDDRLEGLLLKLETSIYYNRLEEAREIALNIETFAQKQTDGRYNSYRYIARAVSRLVDNQSFETINALKEEFGRLKAENEHYRRSVLDTETRNSLTDSVLSLQDSNVQIQELLLQTLREDYEKAREELTLTRSYLDTGETLATLEAKEKTREGYAEGINEARVLLEQSLRIRSRDGRVEFLKQARTRWTGDNTMVRLIDTLLERL